MTRFAKRYGYKIEYTDTDPQGLLMGLKTGKFDMLATSISYTEERAQTILFSDPAIRFLGWALFGSVFYDLFRDLDRFLHVFLCVLFPGVVGKLSGLIGFAPELAIVQKVDERLFFFGDGFVTVVFSVLIPLIEDYFKEPVIHIIAAGAADGFLIFLKQ